MRAARLTEQPAHSPDLYQKGNPVDDKSVTSLFTFGYSQLCPYTGKDLGDHYALVTAPDRSSARLFMNTAFKRNYAFEYDGPGDHRIADYVPRMALHITVNLVPEQPTPADPTGLTYSRADDGETTQPIAGRVPPHFGAVVNEGGHTAVQVAGGLIEIDPPEGFVPASAESWRQRQQIGTAECGCPIFPFPEGRGAPEDEIVDHVEGCRAQEELA